MLAAFLPAIFMIALILISSTFLLGLVVMTVELRRAPEAYEDQDGLSFRPRE